MRLGTATSATETSLPPTPSICVNCSYSMSCTEALQDRRPQNKNMKQYINFTSPV